MVLLAIALKKYARIILVSLMVRLFLAELTFDFDFPRNLSIMNKGIG